MGENREGHARRVGFRVMDRYQEKEVLLPTRPSMRMNLQRAQDSGELGPDVLNCPTLRHKLLPRPSPFVSHNYFGGGFVSDTDRVFLESLLHGSNEKPSRKDSHENMEELKGALSSSMVLEEEDDFMDLPQFALRAGPRETIYHNPELVQIGIVVVGSLCPGINDVVRSIVSKAITYGVPEGNIRGIPFGFKGFQERQYQKPIPLTQRSTDAIHMEGGSVLGIGSPEGDVTQIVKWLDLWSIDMLFVVGGVRGMSVAAAVQEECDRVNVPAAVIAIPKAIDNHILLVDRTFGFDTAVEEAQRALAAAKVEASSAYRGVGIVKLMGRQSGFITVKASLAFGQVDVCLIPEVPFSLEGDGGLLAYLDKVLESRGHAVICIAEGAAQDMIPEQHPRRSLDGPEHDDYDGSPEEGGYHRLKDAGMWLRDQLKRKLKDVDVKYIDPSYLIRSVPASSNDRIYCKMLAHGAVHAGFAGYTGTMVGLVNTHMVYLPLVAGQAVRKVDAKGSLWSRLLATTGQPRFQ